MAVEFQLPAQSFLDPELPGDVFSTLVDIFWKRMELRKK